MISIIFTTLTFCLSAAYGSFGVNMPITRVTLQENSTCEMMLQNFANFSAAFTYCTINNARPISICQSCVRPYVSVVKVYEDISEVENNVGFHKCGDELANLDRLQVFDSGYHYVTDLWRRAYCDSCYVMDALKGQPTFQLTELVRNILNASQVYNACVLKYRNETLHPDEETCEMCLEDYQRINNIYGGFKTFTGGIEFCMDIVDLINRTRNEWSDVIGCFKAKRKPEMVLLLSSAAIGFLPVIFYIAVYTFTSKKMYALVNWKRWNENSAMSTSSVFGRSTSINN